MIGLFVSVPVASFRVPQAREYWETLPCPPPATVYGMLLAAVGEPNRLHHEGAEVALALLSAPELSVVVRTLWRVKDHKLAPGIGENRRPDFQELLSNVRLAVWVRTGAAEAARPSLSDRVAAALARPSDGSAGSRWAKARTSLTNCGRWAQPITARVDSFSAMSRAT
jgi:CRISPR-associated protein Cas5t